MENSSVASASSEAGSTRSQEIEELERFIDSYVLEYQVQGLLGDKNETYLDGDNKPQSHISQNGNREGSFDILGTDIWAANTMDSHGYVMGATWDLQPEKLDFSQFHRKPFRGTPKHLQHIDREGSESPYIPPIDPLPWDKHDNDDAGPFHYYLELMMKGKFEYDDGINLNDMEQFLPGLTGFPPLPNEAEIAQTKKLFRRRRNDRRRQQQRPPGGGEGDRKTQQQQQSPQQQQQQTVNQHPRDQQQHRGQCGGSHGQQFQGHGGQRQGPLHHGYSQNRRWHHNQQGQGGEQGPQGGPAVGRDRGGTPTGDRDKGAPPRKNEETDVKAEEASARLEPESSRGPNDGPPSQPGGQGGPKVRLLPSSKERLRRRLKDEEEAIVSPAGPQRSRMDRLLEILNSMRNNSAGVDGQLSSFMEEAQTSTQSEESLAQIVSTIYGKALSDRSFAASAARLCDKMATFMVEGTKFRSLLLNMLQKDFSRRKELQASDVERWLGFITFLCEMFGTMRSSAGEPFRVLVCPIYTCLRELLESPEVKEDAVLCYSMELQSTGRLLEEQLPEMMTELLAAARDKMLCPAESQLTRSLLMEVIELHANHWTPLEDLTTQYYNRTIQKLTTA
uniref:CBP80/20-dependent translation initiation factor-like isoform X6 n=1 Tax=Oncorhynchus gorbuscha TaxID=8017 RepID=UPI001EAEF849|nr:CBP80/20-dependent translation initiation factor-like isoform X6 [Oncorhynchus gorbuscha]